MFVKFDFFFLLIISEITHYVVPFQMTGRYFYQQYYVKTGYFVFYITVDNRQIKYEYSSELI